MSDRTPSAGPGAAHEWSSLPPRRDQEVARRRWLPLLAPLVLAALLWLVGQPTLALIVLVVATRVTAATTISVGARDRFDRLAGWIGRQVGSALTFVLLGAVQLLVFTPVALLARLTRTDPMDPLAGHDAPSRWLTRTSSSRVLHRRTYSDERYRREAGGTRSITGSPRWIRGLVGGLALLLLADLALGSALARVGADDPDAPASLDGANFGFDPAAQEALASQPGAQELMAELQTAGGGEPDPYLGWRFGEETIAESDLLTITDGVRRTRATSVAGPAAEVWFFGGSTMYGSGQQDLATIPSLLVGKFNEAGIAVNATNFGRPAYSQWQQVLLLEQELTADDRPEPDLVVFYDGFNDLTLQTQFGVHDEPTHLSFRATTSVESAPPTAAATLRSWWADHSAIALATDRIRGLFADDPPAIRLADLTAAPIETIDPRAAADAALAIHRRGVDHVLALSSTYGFDTRFFWQPFLYTREPLTPAEKELVDLPGYDTAVWLPMINRLRDQLSDPVIDLSDALDGEPGSLFWDFVHTNERGAALVADAMEPQLVAALSN